jgi:hypothetical protein
MATAEHELRFEMDKPGSYRVTVAGENAGWVEKSPEAYGAKPWAWTICRPFVGRTTAGRTRTLADARRAVASVLPKEAK